MAGAELEAGFHVRPRRLFKGLHYPKVSTACSARVTLFLHGGSPQTIPFVEHGRYRFLQLESIDILTAHILP